MAEKTSPGTSTEAGCVLPDFEVGDLVVGRYHVERLLGHGGMGSVYLVQDIQRNTAPLALKYVDKKGLDSVAIDQLRDEFRTSAQHEHPHLLRGYDFGFDPDRGGCYFTSEYVEGVDLLCAVWGLDLNVQQSLEAFLGIFVQLLRGLAFLHDQGFVYEDLKPDNIIVTRDEPRHVKLIDFGLVSRQGKLRGERVWATPSYVAPETILGTRVGLREDLYSLGVVLYQATTGILPFPGENNLEILRGHLEIEPAPPSSIVPELPEPFDPLILGLLQKKPENRPERATDVIAEINRLFDLSFALEDLTTAPAYLGLGEVAVRQRELSIATKALRSACWPEIVTRAVPAEFAESAFATAAVPAGRVLWLKGEVGAGDEILLERLSHEAQLQKIETLELDAVGDTPESLVLWIDETLHWVRRFHSSGAVDGLLELRSALVRKVEEADQNHDDLVDRSLARAASRLVEHGAESPWVLVIRNLQSSRGLALNLVKQLIGAATRTEDELRHLVIATFRAGESAAAAESLLSQHGSASLGVDLGRVEESDLRRFLKTAFRGGEFPQQFVERVLSESEGRLREVRALFGHFIERQWIERLPSGWRLQADAYGTHLVGPVRVEIRERLRVLPDDVYRLAVAFAFLGAEITAAQAGSLARVPSERLNHAVQQLLDEQLIREGPKDDSVATFSIASTSTRSTIYGLLTTEQSKALHELTGQLLEASMNRPGVESLHDLSYHYLSAGNCKKGHEYGVASAEAYAGELFFDRALATYRRVRDVCEGDPVMGLVSLIQRMSGLRLEVGDYRGVLADFALIRRDSLGADRAQRRAIEIQALRAHTRLGEFGKARSLLADLNSTRSALDPEMCIELSIAEAELHHARDAHVESLRACEAAAERLSESSSPELEIRVHLGLAENYDALGAVGDAAGHCQRALRLLEASRERRDLATSFLSRGRYYMIRRQYAEALQMLRLGLSLRRDSNAFVGVADCMFELGRLLRWLGDFDDARRYLKAARSVYRRMEARAWEFEAEVELIDVDRLLGLMDDLAERSANAVRNAMELGKPDLVDRALIGAANGMLDRGDFENGRETLRRLDQQRNQMRRSRLALELTLLKAEMALVEGDFTTALDYANSAVKEARELRDPLLVTRSLRWQTDILLRLGKTSKARRSLAALLDVTIRQELPFEEGWGRLLDAIALLAAGKSSLAKKALAIAQERLTEHGGPRDRIELHLHRASCHFATGELELAYVSLEEGLHLARHLKLKAAEARFLIGRAVLEAKRPAGQGDRVESYLEQAVAAAKHYPECRWQALELWAHWCRENGPVERASELERLTGLAFGVVAKKLPRGTERSYRQACLFREYADFQNS